MRAIRQEHPLKNPPMHGVNRQSATQLAFCYWQDTTVGADILPGRSENPRYRDGHQLVVTYNCAGVLTRASTGHVLVGLTLRAYFIRQA